MTTLSMARMSRLLSVMFLAMCFLSTSGIAQGQFPDTPNPLDAPAKPSAKSVGQKYAAQTGTTETANQSRSQGPIAQSASPAKLAPNSVGKQDTAQTGKIESGKEETSSSTEREPATKLDKNIKSTSNRAEPSSNQAHSSNNYIWDTLKYIAYFVLVFFVSAVFIFVIVFYILNTNKSIKELRERNDALHKRFDELKKNLDSLEMRQIELQRKIYERQSAQITTPGVPPIARTQLDDQSPPVSSISNMEEIIARYGSALSAPGTSELESFLSTYEMTPISKTSSNTAAGTVVRLSKLPASASHEDQFWMCLDSVRGEVMIFPGRRHHREVSALISNNWAQANDTFRGVFELREGTEFRLERPGIGILRGNSVEVRRRGILSLPPAARGG